MIIFLNITEKFYEENFGVTIPEEECNLIFSCLDSHCWISWGFISMFNNFTDYTSNPFRNLGAVSSSEVISGLYYVEFAEYYENSTVIKLSQEIGKVFT